MEVRPSAAYSQPTGKLYRLGNVEEDYDSILYLDWGKVCASSRGKTHQSRVVLHELV